MPQGARAPTVSDCRFVVVFSGDDLSIEPSLNRAPRWQRHFIGKGMVPRGQPQIRAQQNARGHARKSERECLLAAPRRPGLRPRSTGLRGTTVNVTSSAPASKTGYDRAIKTAISIPNGDFERLARITARHGMNRSEFYRLVGSRLAEELEGEAELTALANSVIARVGQPSADSPFSRESERSVREGTQW